MPEMTHLQIVALYAALNALIALVLAINAGGLRGKTKVLLGDGGNDNMLRAMRAHANNAEYVPLVLVLLLLLGILKSSTFLLHGVGAALTVGRILHGVGLNMSGGLSFGRIAGTALTFIAIIAEIVALLMAAFA